MNENNEGDNAGTAAPDEEQQPQEEHQGDLEAVEEQADEEAKDSYSGYSSPPLACIIIFTASLFVLSIFFLAAAFEQKPFIASANYMIKNMNFKMFNLADEIADMNFASMNLQWTLTQPDGSTINSASPPVFNQSVWDLGTVNIPYKVTNSTPFELLLKYDDQEVKYIIPIEEIDGEYYVAKPVYIAFLATPGTKSLLTPASPKYVDRFIGYSPIPIKIISNMAPETAYLDYGFGKKVSEFTIFLILFCVGLVTTVALVMFAIYALQIMDVANNYTIKTVNGKLIRKYDDPTEIRENERIPIYE